MLAGIEYVCIAYGFVFMLGSTVGLAETVIGAGARDISTAKCLCDDTGVLVVLKYVHANNSHPRRWSKLAANCQCIEYYEDHEYTDGEVDCNAGLI